MLPGSTGEETPDTVTSEDELKYSLIVLIIGFLALVVFVIVFNARKSCHRLGRCCVLCVDVEVAPTEDDNEADQIAEAYSAPPPAYHIAIDMPKPDDERLKQQTAMNRQDSAGEVHPKTVSGVRQKRALFRSAGRQSAVKPGENFPVPGAVESKKKQELRSNGGTTGTISDSEDDKSLCLSVSNLPNYHEALRILQTKQNMAVRTDTSEDEREQGYA